MGVTCIMVGDESYAGISYCPSQQARDMAALLVELDSHDMAIFFNTLAEHVSEWHGRDGMQWLDVGEKLSPKAKRMIENMADHVKEVSAA